MCEWVSQSVSQWAGRSVTWSVRRVGVAEAAVMEEAALDAFAVGVSVAIGEASEVAAAVVEASSLSLSLSLSLSRCLPLFCRCFSALCFSLFLCLFLSVR